MPCPVARPKLVSTRPRPRPGCASRRRSRSRLSIDYRFYDEDNKTPIFEARNALTGEYGMILMDGVQGSAVPFEIPVFVPGVPGDPAFHFRSIPFETRRQTLETSGGLPDRPQSARRRSPTRASKSTGSFAKSPRRSRTACASSGAIAVGKRQRCASKVSTATRDGNGYNPDPYEEFYSSSPARCDAVVAARLHAAYAGKPAQAGRRGPAPHEAREPPQPDDQRPHRRIRVRAVSEGSIIRIRVPGSRASA